MILSKRRMTLFIETNIQNETFKELGINLIVFRNGSGEMIFGREYDLKEDHVVFLNDWWNTNHLPGKFTTDKDPAANILGILMVNQRPMMVAVRQVLTSEGNGPVYGTLTFGRYLDKEEIDQLSAREKLPIAIEILNSPDLPKEFQEAKNFVTIQNPIFVREANGQLISGYTYIKDITGEPALILKETQQRQIYNTGLESNRIFTLIVVIFGVILTAVIAIILESQILSRLAALTQDIKNIAKQKIFH